MSLCGDDDNEAGTEGQVRRCRDPCRVVTGPEGEILDWDAVGWRKVEDDVRRLRQRIFTASQAGTSNGSGSSTPATHRACLSRMHGNRARPVLRGARRSNAPGLPGLCGRSNLSIQEARASCHANAVSGS